MHSVDARNMTHNPLNCLWRRWLRPLFIGGADLVGNPPETGEFTEDMQKTALDYLYRRGDLEDFFEYLKDGLRRRHWDHDRGVVQWLNYMDTDRGELVSAPAPGLISFVLITVVFPLVALGVAASLLFFLFSGISTWWNNL